MKPMKIWSAVILTILINCFSGTFYSQTMRARTTQNACDSAPGLNGVYRINTADSDQLYSVIENASSNVPYSEQQQFFMDLAVRLTPPDLLAIECRGTKITLGSSRAARVVFQADNVERSNRNADNQIIHSRIKLERGSLVFNSSGGNSDNLIFSFTPLENGQKLRVSRRIAAKELIEPVVIQTVYNKIADVARWDIYGETQTDRQTAKLDNKNDLPVADSKENSLSIENNEAQIIRKALNDWIEATTRRDIERQMSFYMPQLQAFYLTRNASRSSVRAEKIRLSAAKSIDIHAAEPEIIFQAGGTTAIMRFRKKYQIGDNSKVRRGEVVQELRWQKTGSGWKIFSERDVKVIS